MNKIIPIPALTDNYIWCILSPDNKQAVIVDPGDAKPVLDTLQTKNIILSGILITHHHCDHTNGLKELTKKFPKCPVYGPNIPYISHPVKHNDQIPLQALNTTLSVIETPGHTLDHLCYWNEQALFCGDTLFASGCGRVFEGTHEQMVSSLTKLRNLSDNIQMYCAHEYTENNLQFALTIESNNQLIIERLNETKALRQKGLPSLPTTMGLEKATNPFLRFDEKALYKTIKNLKSVDTHNLNLTDPITTFSILRGLKDKF